MEFEQYVKLAQDNVIEINAGGQTHYMIAPSLFNTPFLSMMQNDNLAAEKKQLLCMAYVLCTKEGKTIFDPENEEHLNVINGLKRSVQIELLEQVSEALRPKKKLEDLT